MMMSSDTSWPASITFFAATPRGVPAFTAARSMSPVEICGMANFSRRNLACVPLPAPGGPSRIKFIKAGSGSCKHSTHDLQVLRGVDAGRNLSFAHGHRDPVAVPEDPELFQRLGFFQRAFLQRREFRMKPRPVGVEAGVAVAGRARLSGVGNPRARKIQRVPL